MLFISRFVSLREGLEAWSKDNTKVGVVDTDDWSEDIILGQRLRQLVHDHKLQIGGVRTAIIEGEYHVQTYRPYQHSSFIIPQQAKLKMLYDIEITRYRERITSIYWKPSELPMDVSIRLSDFGKSCGDSMLTGVGRGNGCIVTIILDDNIQFGQSSFGSFIGVLSSTAADGLKFDIRELTNECLAKRLYRFVSIWQECCEPNEIGDGLIDNSERFKRLSEEVMR